MRVIARGACALATVLIAGCVPDDFAYGSEQGVEPELCDRDDCQPATPACQELWNGSLDAWQTRSLFVDAERSRVLASGVSSADGRQPTAAVAAIARCDGVSTQITSAHTSDEPSVATGLAPFDEAVLVSVSTASSSAIASLDAVDLGQRWSLPVAAESGSALHGITRVEAYAWAIGQSGLDAGSEPLAIEVGPDQSLCSFTFGAGAGAARGVAVSGASVLVAGELSGAVTVWRFDDSGCALPAPAASSAPLLPSDAVAARVAAFVVAGASAYVGGSAERADGSGFGFVLALDVGTLAATGSLDFDPTPGADAVLALASDGKRVVFGGASGMSAPDELETGSGFVAELVLPLAANGETAWITQLASVPAVSALAMEGEADGALYLGTLGGGGLRRCSKLGACFD